MKEPMGRAWAEAWSDRAFRRQLLLSVPALLAALSILANFLNWVEQRPGVILPDPVLSVLPARDVTWLTFALIYLGLVASLALMARHPRDLVRAVQAYSIMVGLRIVVMYATPLEAPPGMIVLQDPLVQHLGTGRALTKDLFFSGHTSTLFLVSLAMRGPRVRALFFACTAAVAFCVLWQHVHYTVDVLAAPFFAYAAFQLAGLLHPPRRLDRG
jgi:membrane-associated phospholipid phosphatase